LFVYTCVLFALTASKIKFKYKMVGTTEKLKTVKGSFIDLDISTHVKKGTEKSREALLLRKKPFTI
jgi:hypothetical protein